MQVEDFLSTAFACVDQGLKPSVKPASWQFEELSTSFCPTGFDVRRLRVPVNRSALSESAADARRGRTDVFETKHLIVFVNGLCRNIFGCNFAENTIIHNGSNGRLKQA